MPVVPDQQLVEGGPGLLVALARALLDLPRRPVAVRLMGWCLACSPSPGTPWAVFCDVSLRGVQHKGFQRAAGRASSPWETVLFLNTGLHPRRARDPGRKEGPLAVRPSPPSALTSV